MLRCPWSKCKTVIHGMTGLRELDNLRKHYMRKHKFALSVQAALEERVKIERGKVSDTDAARAEARQTPDMRKLATLPEWARRRIEVAEANAAYHKRQAEQAADIDPNGTDTYIESEPGVYPPVYRGLPKGEHVYFRLDGTVFQVRVDGEYTYQYVTRDTFGFAMKATYAEINGHPVEVFKKPKTDSGMKSSARGLLRVLEDGTLAEGVSYEEEKGGLLETVFLNGVLTREHTLAEIRARLAAAR